MKSIILENYFSKKLINFVRNQIFPEIELLNQFFWNLFENFSEIINNLLRKILILVIGNLNIKEEIRKKQLHNNTSNYFEC